MLLNKTVKLSPLQQLRNELVDLFYRNKDRFLGEVLTIVDASITDSEQRKGIKDLIKNSYYREEYLRDRLVDILIDFTETFANDIQPKTKEETDSLYGRIPMSADEGMSKMKYFTK